MTNAVATAKQPLLELKGITKRFPGVQALSEVSLDLRPGEVHALVGENGAGKSTLIKVMTGFHQADEGAMLIGGQPVVFSNPHQAIQAGIACIYQELSIVPQLDVAKNLFLGNWPTKGKFLDRKALYQQAGEILKRVNLDVSPKALASDLSIAQQQMVEIGRALTRNTQVIIMDEPTSSLTDKEAAGLMDLIRQLKAEGTTIVYISHKLDEVLSISDSITVLCDGKNATTVPAEGTSRDQLIQYMLGRTLTNMFNKQNTEIGQPVMCVQGLTREPAFRNISFEVRAGEVLGFFGLVGAGRSEIMWAIFGVDKATAGTVTLNGQSVHIRSPKDAVANGLALVPEDRKHDGLALRLSVMENMTLVKLPDISPAGFIDQAKRRQLSDTYVSDIRVKTPSIRQLAGNLSGGNQQKVVISKWLMTDPKVLILDEPTRGIDVGSKSEIYALIDQLASQGMAVIVVTSEMNEILGICDRIITVYEGNITREFTRDEFSDTAILAAALGGEAG